MASLGISEALNAGELPDEGEPLSSELILVLQIFSCVTSPWASRFISPRLGFALNKARDLDGMNWVRGGLNLLRFGIFQVFCQPTYAERSPLCQKASNLSSASSAVQVYIL